MAAEFLQLRPEGEFWQLIKDIDNSISDINGASAVNSKHYNAAQDNYDRSISIL